MAETRNVIAILTSNDFVLPFSVSSSFFVAAYFAIPRFYPTIFSTEKAKAWILTFLAAVVMTLGSLPFLMDHLHLGRASMAASSLLDSQLARYLCAFFVSYLIFDLALGSVFYPKHVHPLSGYFHHTLYIYMVIALLHYKVPGGFATCGILELPTSIMAVGCFNKKWRNDLLFGTTFFATRIALHAYFIADLYAAFPGRYLWVFLAGVFPLHVMWFRGWITQQTRLRKQRLAAVVEKERMEAVTEKNSTRAKVVVGPTDGEIQGWEMVRGPVAASRAISRPKRRRSQPSILLRTGAPVPEILKTERYTPICVPVA